MKKRNLSPEEKRIWARVSRGIEPLSRGIHRPVAPEHMPHLEDMTTDITPSVEPTERKRPRWTLPKPHQPDEPRRTPAPPLNRGGEKRVRRGQIEIAASFDLHGFTQDKAPLALYQFVSTQRRQGARCVLVITGRGRAGGGVLRERLVDWLSMADVRVHVSGYSQANRKHGGAGAWYVFLRAWPG